jgi:hypothetical protein
MPTGFAALCNGRCQGCNTGVRPARCGSDPEKCVQALAVGVAARRNVLYQRFLERWEALFAGTALTELTQT